MIIHVYVFGAKYCGSIKLFVVCMWHKSLIHVETAGRKPRKKLSIDSAHFVFTATISGTFLANRNYDGIEIVCKATNPTPTNKLGDYTEEDRATVYLKRKMQG